MLENQKVIDIRGYSKLPNKRPGTAIYFEKDFDPISLYLGLKTNFSFSFLAKIWGKSQS